MNQHCDFEIELPSHAHSQRFKWDSSVKLTLVFQIRGLLDKRVPDALTQVSDYNHEIGHVLPGEFCSFIHTHDAQLSSIAGTLRKKKLERQKFTSVIIPFQRLLQCYISCMSNWRHLTLREFGYQGEKHPKPRLETYGV